MFLCIALSFFVYIVYKLIKGDIQCVYGSILGASGAKYPESLYKGDAFRDKDGFNKVKGNYNQHM